MPFYGGTRRVLMGAPAPVFLPAVGPFSGLALKLASSVPDRTISTVTQMESSSRTSPFEYNTLTIASGASIAAPNTYYIAIRCNILNLTGGTIDLSGGAGYLPGGQGGAGACGGGGGGGAASNCDPCDIFAGGSGGGQLGPALLDGQAGADGTVDPGYPGGLGYAGNWKNDGYNYVADLGGNFQTVTGQPYLYGGSGSNGGFQCCSSFHGGSGGGSGGGFLIQANKIIGNGTAVIISMGGGAETGGNGQVAQGGDGGWLWIGARSYPSAILNGKVNVQADSLGSNNGVAKLFKITGNTFTTASVATPF